MFTPRSIFPHPIDDAWYKAFILILRVLGIEDAVLAPFERNAPTEVFARMAVVTQEDVFTLPAPGGEDLHVGVVTRDAVQTPFRSTGIDQVVAILWTIGTIDILTVFALHDTPSKDAFAVLQVVASTVFAVLEITEETWELQNPRIELFP